MRSNKKNLYPEISRQFENRAELAEVIDKSVRTVTRMLSGERPFTKRERVKVCAYLGMDEAEVFRKEDIA